MKLRVRLGRRTVVCSLDESHGEPTVVSAKEEVRNQFELANVPFSLSLNSSDLPDINDNTTLSDLGVVSGDLVFVVVAGGAPVAGIGQHDNRQQVLNSSAAETPSNTDSATSIQNQSRRQRTDPEPPGGPLAELPLPPNQGLLITATDNPNEIRVQDNEAIHDAESNRCLNEPMFVRDSTSVAVPHTLCAIVASGVVENAHDALCCVLHLLMSEAGFRTLPSAGSDERLSTQMPQQWRFPGTYRLGYEHPAYDGTTFELLCVPLGSAITIHGTVKSSADAVSQMQDMSLNVNEFVQENHPVATQMYRNLPKLSRLFKDGLVYWLLQMGQPDGDPFLIPCLQGLPMELKLMVMKHLDARSLVRLSAVCKEFHTCSRERILWRRLYLRNFGRRTVNDLAQDWFQLYKDKVEERRAIREMYRQQTLIFTSGPFPDRHPPLNPYLPRYDPFGAFHPGPPTYPPGFIGGEYDLRPNFPGPFRGRLPRPRFDPFSPFPNPRFRPGRGGGLFEGMGGFGPRFL